MRRPGAAPLALAAPLLALGCRAAAAPGDDGPAGAHGDAGAVELFDGASLAGWRVVELGGGGEVAVVDGRLVLGQGAPLTGVALDAPALELPREGYELIVVAARLAGSDFFVGLTFPVGEAHATVVLGGWGGALCGLSCVDGSDASSNATRSFRAFTPGAQVTLRVAVASDAIRAWVDGEPLFEHPRPGHAFGLRPEMLPCRPLGLASYQTRAAISRVALIPPRGAAEPPP